MNDFKKNTETRVSIRNDFKKNNEIKKSNHKKYLPTGSMRWWVWLLSSYFLGQSLAFFLGAAGWFVSILPIAIATSIYLNYMTKHDKLDMVATTTDSNDKDPLEIKISTIKLGFKSINHISLTDEDMHNLPNNELKRYYKAGVKAMKGKL